MKKILIIEDNVDLQEIYQQVLSEEGFSIFPATTSLLGIQLAETEQPHLILLDVMLPGHINGLEVLKILREKKELLKTPIVIFSNLDIDKKDAISQGATDCLLKADISLDTLITTVKKLTA